MSNHAEHDLLSAYADGELSASEHAAVGAHLEGCADARALLDGIRATLADLRAMGEPAMDEQVSFAIRAAVARERRLSGRSRRYAWIGAAAAAAVIAVGFVAIGPLRGGNSAGTEALDSVMSESDQNYSKATVGSVLDAYVSSEYGITAMRADSAPADTAAGAEGGAGRSVLAPKSNNGPQSAANYAQVERPLDECVATVRAEGQSARLVRAVTARLDGEPVYLMLFEIPSDEPERVELWAVSRASCDVRYFSQEPVK